MKRYTQWCKAITRTLLLLLALMSAHVHGQGVNAAQPPQTGGPLIVTLAQAQLEPAIPAGWDEEGEGADHVTVGSKDGDVVAWMIKTVVNDKGEQNGELYRYLEGSMEPNPWIKHVAKDVNGNIIEDWDDISTSSDGITLAVSAYEDVLKDGVLQKTGGDIYQYNEANNYWVKLPSIDIKTPGKVLKFDGVSVGNQKNVWATEVGTNNCYQLVDGVWELRSTACTDIATGLDGYTLGVNPVNNVYEYNATNKDWDQVLYTDATGNKKSLKLTQVTVGKRDAAWGIYEHDGMSEIWFWNKEKQNWERAKSADGADAHGLVSIACNAAGTTMGAEELDGIWMYDLGGVEIVPPAVPQPPAPAISVPQPPLAVPPAPGMPAPTVVQEMKLELGAAAPAPGMPLAAVPAVQGKPSGKKTKRSKAKKEGKIVQPKRTKKSRQEKKTKKDKAEKERKNVVAQTETKVVKDKKGRARKAKVTKEGKVLKPEKKEKGKKGKTRKKAKEEKVKKEKTKKAKADKQAKATGDKQAKSAKKGGKAAATRGRAPTRGKADVGKKKKTMGATIPKTTQTTRQRALSRDRMAQ